MTEGMTIKEAAESWVSSFNAVQRGIIATRPRRMARGHKT